MIRKYGVNQRVFVFDRKTDAWKRATVIIVPSELEPYTVKFDDGSKILCVDQELRPYLEAPVKMPERYDAKIFVKARLLTSQGFAEEFLLSSAVVVSRSNGEVWVHFNGLRKQVHSDDAEHVWFWFHRRCAGAQKEKNEEKQAVATEQSENKVKSAESMARALPAEAMANILQEAFGYLPQGSDIDTYSADYVNYLENVWRCLPAGATDNLSNLQRVINDLYCL